MKFTKNWKRFFTLDRHHAEGFTLVELIVVIAILAILSAVAVPAYSGYITKAQKASDLQLLGAVSTAFASACLEKGIDAEDLQGTTIEIDKDGLLGTMKYGDVTLADTPDYGTMGISVAFYRYYGENASTPFKYFVTKLTYTENGWEGQEPGAKDTGLFGQVINELLSSGTISDETVEKIKGSEFGNIGAEELLNKVVNVTDLSNKLAMGDGDVPGNVKYQQFLQSGKDNLMLTLTGKTMADVENMTEEEFETFYADFEASYQALIDQKVATGLSTEAAEYSILTNYAVLNAAANTDSNKTALELGTAVENGTLTGTMLKNLMKNNDPATSQAALADAAMMYGMYTAWANSLPEGQEKTNALANASTIDGFISDMGNDDFVSYLKDTNGSAQTDLDGYIAAMDIINKSAHSGNDDALSNLLVNGYGDTSLQAALQELLK